jgi:hypothetical protein
MLLHSSIYVKAAGGEANLDVPLSRPQFIATS